LPFGTIGLFHQLHSNLVFTARNKGLGSVINGQGIMQSAVVRKEANIPENEVTMTCVAMGYPDEDFQANYAAHA